MFTLLFFMFTTVIIIYLYIYIHQQIKKIKSKKTEPVETISSLNLNNIDLVKSQNQLNCYNHKYNHLNYKWGGCND